MSVFWQAVGYLVVALPAVARAQAFATVSIKPAGLSDWRSTRVQMRPNGDLITHAVPVITLLSQAYDLPANPSPRLGTLPDWTVRERYDIEARAGSNSLRLPAKQMIRRLLAEQFKLVMRAENQTMPVYDLTVVPGGPKLQKSSVVEKDCAFDNSAEACHDFAGGLGHPLNAKAIDMDDLAHYIGNWTDLPVVNRTALSGLFTVTAGGWVPMRLPPPPPNAVPAANPFAGLPTVFEVLGKLGLELQRQEAVLPVYTVERIERPASN